MRTPEQRELIVAVQEFCRRRYRLVSAAQYASTTQFAERRGVRAPNGMIIHLPRATSAWVSSTKKYDPIAYILWYGEPLDQIEETVAYMLLAYPERPELRIIHCLDRSRP